MPSTNTNTLSRRSFIKGAALLGAMIPLSSILAACSTDNNNAEEGQQAASSDSQAASSILIAYYSAQGHTESVARVLADELGADTFVITPAQPYTNDDLNYNNDDSRVSKEHIDDNRHVELETITPENFDNYETVLIGYPIWWANAAWVLDDFVSENDFTGKTVIPFCTSASSPLGQSGELLAEMARTGNWQDGMRFRQSADEEEVRQWANDLSLS